MVAKLRVLNIENANSAKRISITTQKPTIASARAAPEVRLVDVVLHSIARDIRGEFAAALQAAGLPIHAHGHFLHVRCVGGWNAGIFNLNGAAVNEAALSRRRLRIVRRAEGRR